MTFLKNYLYIYLFIYFWPCGVFFAAQAFLSLGQLGSYSLVVVHRLLITVASLVAKHGL